jgi:hypothetical protein
MKIIVVLALVCLVAVWLFKRRKSSIIRVEKKKSNISDPQIALSVDTTPSNNFDKPNTFENSDTGSVIKTQDGGWILNPKSTFPLTVYGIDLQTVEEIKRLLDSTYSTGNACSIDHLIPPNFHCKEIDDYVREFKPQYLRKIEELKRSSKKWASASEDNQEDLLFSLREKAIKSLDIQPYCDLEFLLEYDPNDATIDERLVDRFGYNNIQLYLRYAYNSVSVIPADHYHHSGFEKLVEIGLAKRGYDISLSAILGTLSLREMNELVAVWNQKPFGRKIKAVDFLTNAPDAKQKLSDLLAFKGFFQLKPLPDEFSNFDISKYSEASRYSFEIGRLITNTYIAGCYTICDMHQYRDALSFIKGWELLTRDDDDTCLFCKRAASKSYSKNHYPKVPWHIGCRCTVLTKLKDEL